MQVSKYPDLEIIKDNSMSGQTHLNSPENICSVLNFTLHYMWKFNSQ